MTMPAGFLRDDYLGDGSQDEYDFTFKIFDSSDLQVVVADDQGDEFPVLVEGVDYNVVGAGDDDGGHIELIDVGQDWIDSGNLKNDYLITILSNRPSAQGISLRNEGPFYPDVIEQAFDKLTILIKQLEEKMSRVLSLPATTDLSDIDIGPPIAGYFLAWDSLGQTIEAVPGPGSINRVSGETPSGAINNSNTAFTIANDPYTGSFRLYKNGRRTTEFSRTGQNITMNTAPNFGEELLADYEY